MALSKHKLYRLDDKFAKILVETKQKNNLKSLAEAANRIADYINTTKKNKKFKEKIIREIEI